MKHSPRLALYLSFLLLSTTQAAITTTGNVEPEDWTSTALEAYIGKTSAGNITVTSGDSIASNFCYLGYDSNATGIATITGSGSSWHSNAELNVGYNGIGELNITNCGFVQCYDFSQIGVNTGSTGTVNVSGHDAVWSNKGHLKVGIGGTGTLNITNGGLVCTTASLLTIDENQSGNSFINISTGGMLAITDQAEGSLSYFLDAFNGTADTIRWWDRSSNSWASIADATIGIDYTLEHFTEGELNGYTVLTVGNELAPGDANGDGVVDGSDVTILANNWQVGVSDGRTANWSMGDFNYDGKVDGSDVTILANYWQDGVNATATAVPEPGCVAMLFSTLFATGLVWTRSFKRRNNQYPS